jgi:hypothetical protein
VTSFSHVCRSLLAGWLVLFNLSLGLYHCHGDAVANPTTAGPVVSAGSPHAPAWHYHLAVLGLEIDLLSATADQCPFESSAPASGEVHVLLAKTCASNQDRGAHNIDLAQVDAMVSAPCELLAAPAASRSLELPFPMHRAVRHPVDTRSGVQQI